MCQTLFFIPDRVGDWPLFGAGVLLLVVVVGGLVWLGWLAWRQGFGAEVLGHVPLFALLAAIVAWLLPKLLREIPHSGGRMGLPIRGYGVMMVAAILAAAGLLAWRARRRGLPAELAVSMAFWTCVPGVVGARLFYVIQKWPTFTPYWNDGAAALAVAMLNVTEGGLVVYGAVLGGMAGLVGLLRRRRIPLLAGFDLIAPSFFLGLCLGRIGCFLNGCCYGGVCELPWAVRFPHDSLPFHGQAASGELWGFRLARAASSEAVIERLRAGSAAAEAGLRPGDRIAAIDGVPVERSIDAQAVLHAAVEHGESPSLRLADARQVVLPPIDQSAHSAPVHPAQLYSSFNALLLCLVLLAYDPFRRHDGALLALALTLYPVTRFLLEMLRTDEPPTWPMGWTIAQNVSVALLAVGLGLWAWVWWRKPGVAWHGPSNG